MLPALINKLPKYILIDLRNVYDVLDELHSDEELPMMDMEAVMSIVVDLLFKPSNGGRILTDTVKFIVTEFIGKAFTDSLDVEEVLGYYRIRDTLMRAILMCYREFEQHGLYLENRLLYDYGERRTDRIALLRRRQHICL